MASYFYFKILENWADGEETIIKEGQESGLSSVEEWFAQQKQKNIWSAEAIKQWKKMKIMYLANLIKILSRDHA